MLDGEGGEVADLAEVFRFRTAPPGMWVLPQQHSAHSPTTVLHTCSTLLRVFI
jgi:hypothetical protein